MSSHAEDLSSKKRYTDAARVLLDYSKDIREAVIALVSGNAFSEAGRVVRCDFFMYYPNFEIIPIDQPQFDARADGRRCSSSSVRK